MQQIASHRRTSGRPDVRRQSGASAVEFALLFPVFFAMIYACIVYSFVFMLKQSITFAAQEAAEAAVDVRPGIAGYDALVTASATATANSVVQWMPSALRSSVSTSVQFCPGVVAACAGLGPGDDAVVVVITLPLTGSSQLFASITMPFVGTFPPLPATMTAQGVARV